MMAMFQLTAVVWLSCAFLTIGKAGANGAPNSNDPTSFIYSELTSVNFSDDEISSIDHDFDSCDEGSDFVESKPSVVSSSLLYDGGCLVSSQALMCTGGEMNMGNFDVDDFENFDEFFDESDDEDDDDDDDDDGHSSMLSNASLRRSRILAGASGSSIPKDSSSNRPSSSDKFYMTSDFKASNSNLHSKCNLLAIRGGATGSNLGSEFAKRLFVTALVTLVYEAVLGHILEFIKIAMQTSPPGTTYSKVISDITASKGIAGLWDGFCPWGVVQSLFKGSVFGLAHAIATSILKPLAEDGKLPMQLALTLAGGIGGGFQGYVLSPTLLLKTRVMTNDVFREKMSLIRTTWLSMRIGVDVVNAEGIAALMKGANVFATKRVFDWATRYFFSDLFEALFLNLNNGQPLSVQQKIYSSLLGGTASTFSTLPLDVLVAKTQDAKKAGVKVSAATLFMNDLKERGFAGLCSSYLKGFEARLGHVCFTTVAIKTGTPIVYDALFGVKK